MHRLPRLAAALLLALLAAAPALAQTATGTAAPEGVPAPAGGGPQFGNGLNSPGTVAIVLVLVVALAGGIFMITRSYGAAKTRKRL